MISINVISFDEVKCIFSVHKKLQELTDLHSDDIFADQYLTLRRYEEACTKSEKENKKIKLQNSPRLPVRHSQHHHHNLHPITTIIITPDLSQ